MKDQFAGFYDLSDKQLKELWLKPSTLFVFDTNVLLGLYRYGKKTRNDFFALIQKNIPTTVWIPYHVALEYQRNRLQVIQDENDIFNKINKHLIEDLRQSVKPQEYKKLKVPEKFSHISHKIEKFHEQIFKEIKQFEELLQEETKEEPYLTKNDHVRTQIEKIFAGNKTGNKPERQWIEDLYTKGEKRYKNKIPPGFEDMNDKKDQVYVYSDIDYQAMYGDLIIWFQIIEKAKESAIKSVILVADDIKADWQHIVKDNKGNKEIKGARAELREEIIRESNIDNFTILTTPQFIELANNIATEKVNEKSISEVRKSFDNKKINEAIIDLQKITDNIINATYPHDYLEELRNLYIEIPKVEVPKIEIPKIEVPKIEVPKIEVPNFDLPSLKSDSYKITLEEWERLKRLEKLKKLVKQKEEVRKKLDLLDQEDL